MRWGLGLAVALLFTLPAAWAKEARYAAGQVYDRVTSGGVEYALYVPKTWKRGKALPLILIVAGNRQMPINGLSNPRQQQSWARYNADGGGVFVGSVLLQAHNAECPRWKKTVDIPHYLELVERDAYSVEAVLQEVERDLPVERGAVTLFARDFAAEVAMGIAARRPQRFMALLLRDILPATLSDDPRSPQWLVLPDRKDLASAWDLPVVLDIARDKTTEERRTREQRVFRDVLVSNGFRHVRLLEFDAELTHVDNVHPDHYRTYDEILAAARARNALEEKRDGHLEAARKQLGRRKLEPALEAYRKARALEREHELPEASKAVYAALEAEGRRQLAASESLPESKRTAERRRLARLFEGLPLAGELR